MPSNKPHLPDDVVKIAPYLSEEALLILFGGLPVDEIKDSIRQEWSTINQPGESPRSIDETVDRLRAGMEIVQTGGAIGMYIGINRIRDVYRYETTPALQGAQKTVGGYQQALLDAVQQEAAIKQHYGMIGAMALPGVVSIGRVIASGRALEVIRGLRNAETAADYARLARKIALGVKIAEGAGTAGEVAGGVAGAAAGAATSETGPGAFWAAMAVRAVVEAAITYTLSAAGNKIARSIADGYARRMAAQSFASKLFDRQKIIDEFNQYAGVLGNYSSQFNYNNGYSILDQVRGTQQLGLSPASLGYDYSQLNQVLGGLIPNTELNFGQMKNYASMITSLSAIYGVDSSAISPTMSNLAMTTFSQKDVNQAADEFNKFFMSLAGDGKPQLAQLTLVKQLSDFARYYGMGVKFTDKSPDNLARIQQFMSKNVLDNRQSVQPTEQMVQSLDKALEGGAIGSNPRAADLLRVSNITPYEAIKGVTANPDTFNKLLGGLVRTTGIGYNSYDAQNNLSDSKMTQLYMYASKNLDLNNETIQALIPALHAYVTGNRTEAVHTAFLKQLEKNRGNAIQHSPLYDMMQTISDGNVALSKSIADSMPMFKILDDVMFKLYTGILPGVVQGVGTFTTTVSDILKSSNILGDGPVKNPVYTSPPTHQDFIRQATGAATAAGVPNVPVAVAQSALESSYGASGLSQYAFNFFGMKAHPGQQSMSFPTMEYNAEGVAYTTDASFAKYSSEADSFKAYADMIKGSRWYRDAVAAGSNIDQYIAGLLPRYKNGKVIEPGYASDPYYKEKLMAIINQYDLQHYQKYLNAGNKSNDVLQYDSAPLNMKIDLGVQDPQQFVGHITYKLGGTH